MPRDIAAEYREAGKKTQQGQPSKYEKLKTTSAKGGLTWDQADAQTLLTAVAAVTEDGAAVLLAKTSDGGALVLRVISDPESTPFYPSSTAALMDILISLTEIANKP